MVNYVDDFNRTDSTALGTWVELGGDPEIISNQFAPGTTGGYGVARYASPTDTDNQYAEMTITDASSSSMGVFVRSNLAGTNFYLWRGNGITWDMYLQYPGGTFIGIGQFVGPMNNGDVARIECIGNVIKGYVNGVERVSVVDNQLAGAGYHYAGIRLATSTTARVDNFAAGDLEDFDPGAFFNFI